MWNWCIPYFLKVSYADLSGQFQALVIDFYTEYLEKNKCLTFQYGFQFAEPAQINIGGRILYVKNTLPAAAKAIERMGNSKPYLIFVNGVGNIAVCFIQHPLPPPALQAEPSQVLPQTASPVEQQQQEKLVEPPVLMPVEESAGAPAQNTPEHVPTPTTPSPQVSPLAEPSSPDLPKPESTSSLAPDTISVEVSQASASPSD